LVSVTKRPISVAGVVEKTHTMHVKSTAQPVGSEDLQRSELTTGRIKNLTV